MNILYSTGGVTPECVRFFQNDDAPVSLMEMRFFIPSNELAGDVDPVEAFQKQVMNKASVINVSGDAIAIFREIQCLTPRLVYSFILILLKIITFFVLVDVTISKYSNHFSNFTEKHLIIKYLCLQYYGCFCYHIKITGKCFLF